MTSSLTSRAWLIGALFIIAAVSLSYPKTVPEKRPPDHGAMECPACHSLVASIESPTPPAVVINSQCRHCHSDIAAGAVQSSFAFHQDTEKDCLHCHSFHDPGQLLAGSRKFEFDFSNSRKSYQCLACHARGQDLDRLSSGHRRAAFIYHSDDKILDFLSPSDKCMTCHSRQSIVPEIFDLKGRAPELNRHASHPDHIQVHPGVKNVKGGIRDRIDPQINLNDGKLECQTCHSLVAQNNDLLVELSENEGVCLGCHYFD